MKKKAFTLVELIVVITILAILGTIAFISLSNYSKEARDSKRITDTSSLLSKINIEEVRGTNLSDLIINTETGSVQILGKANSEIQTFGRVNFELLKEDGKNFKDPRDKSRNYPAAYTIGGSGKDAYKFIQLATISEKQNKTIIKGNYYTSEDGDAKSLFLTGATSQTESGALIYENNKLPLIYDIGDGVGKDDGEYIDEGPEVSEMIPVPESTNIRFADNLYAKKNEELVGVFSMYLNEYTKDWNSESKCSEAKIIRITSENFDERMNGKTLEDNTIYKIKAGTYTVTGAITLGNCSAIVGEGRDNTIFQRELNNSDLDKIIYSKNNTNIVLAQLSTDGNGEASTTLPGSFAGVYFEYPKGNTTFNNMKAYNNYADGIGELTNGEVRKALGVYFTNIGENFNSDVILNNIESYNNKGTQDVHVRGIELRISEKTYTQNHSGNIKLNNIKTYNLYSENGKIDPITLGKYNYSNGGNDGSVYVSNLNIYDTSGVGLYVSRKNGNININNMEFHNNTSNLKNLNYLYSITAVNTKGDISIQNITVNNNKLESTSTANFYGINTNNPNGNTDIKNIKIYNNEVISTKLGGELFGINLIGDSEDINVKNFSFYNNYLEGRDGVTSIVNRIFTANGIVNFDNSMVFNNSQKHLTTGTNPNYPRGVQIGAKKVVINNSQIFNNYSYSTNNGNRDFMAYSFYYSPTKINSDVLLNNVYVYNNTMTTTSINSLEGGKNGGTYLIHYDTSTLTGNFIFNDIGIYNNQINLEKIGGMKYNLYGINYANGVNIKYYGNINLFGNTVKSTSGTISGTNYPAGFKESRGINSGLPIMKDGNLVETGDMNCKYHIAPGGTSLYGTDCTQLGAINNLQSPVNSYNTNSTNLPKQAKLLKFKSDVSGDMELEEYGVDGVDYNSNQMIGVF